MGSRTDRYSLRLFTPSLVSKLFIPVEALHFEDMLTVWKLDKPRTFILLCTEKDCCNWLVTVVFHTLRTNALLFTHQTTALVLAWQSFVAGLIACRPVTQLATLLAAFVMTTLPGTLFAAGIARLPTGFRANAVHTTVLTLTGAWWTWSSAWLDMESCCMVVDRRIPCAWCHKDGTTVCTHVRISDAPHMAAGIRR